MYIDGWEEGRGMFFPFFLLKYVRSCLSESRVTWDCMFFCEGIFHCRVEEVGEEGLHILALNPALKSAQLA